MKINVGTPDRIVRLVLGLTLIALALFSGLSVFASPLFYWGAIGIGIVLVVTATLRFCPLYLPFGISTARVLRR
ncbi:DUF2892 domain-containing protein [Arsenicitalea aurantiaca]|uniref:DUF2892 domain-containing protein n=1 Tax=Arsenicitalea aurantiaca TaxID=1783274 RepID=A0A433XFB1_9HYPH|nr:DUF2892 domain-containing protein [Arsenicitalea aurantiaca]RUT32791.1 DUF2892 domain-containing protein [Arsenicitalea aurantiaca]